MDSQQLKQRLREQQHNMNECLVTRLHRAISWLQAAEDQQMNADIQFITLWISFNACFSVDEGHQDDLGDNLEFSSFIDKLVHHDNDKQIYRCLWETYSGPVKALIKNPYVFNPFWVSQRAQKDVDKINWRILFDRSSVAALNHLSRQQVPQLLNIVLGRLAVLRNQLIFGGSTYQGHVNREQVTDGAAMLSTLLPVVLDIMMQSNKENWGAIHYPVVQKL